MPYKIIVSFFLFTISLFAQVHYNEQTLPNSGGDVVAMDGSWTVVGDATNNKVHVYPLDYNTFLWDTANKIELSGPKTGGFGTSVAIDDDKIIVGAPDVETWRMEAGQITIEDTFVNPNFTTINLQRTYEEPPLIFVLASNQGSDPSAVRIKNRTINSFEIIHAEPKNRDGSHVAMTVFYLAIERGDHVLPDGTRILASEYNTTHVRYDTTRFSSGETVAFDTISFTTPFGAQPMALGQIQTMENEQGTVPTTPSSPWLTTAIRNVTTNGLELSLERSEVIDGNEVTVPETIAYLVMDAGTGSFNDVNNNSVDFESIYSDDSITGWGTCISVPFTQTFTSNPLVIATKNTLDGVDGGWLRRCNLSTTLVGLSVDEDDYSDTERNHTNERAGILAFSQAFSATFKGGEAYLYEWDNVVGWQLQVTIEPTSLNDDMKYGASVGIHTNEDSTAEIAIGAPEATNTGMDTGKVFTYSWDGTNLTATTVLSSPTEYGRAFGASLDIKGDKLIIGSPGEVLSSDDTDHVGAAHTYAFNGTDWNPDPVSNFMQPNNSDERFGTHVAINSDGNISMIASSELYGSDSYIYTYDGGSVWTESYNKRSQSSGDVDIDDDIYLMASRGQELNFYSTVLGDTDPSEPPPLSIIGLTTDVQAYTSVSLYKEQVLVNEPTNTQAIAIDVPCGIKPGKLNAYEWAMVSVPCGDGAATIGDIFGDDLGIYGDNDNWVMYEQNGTEWSGTFASMRQLEIGDTMELGKGYWIITDANKTWKVDDDVVTTRTQLDTSSITLPETVGGYYFSVLPDTGIGETKKLMHGNPFPRAFKWNKLLVGTSAANWVIGSNNIYEPTGYVYDISQVGQPYRAITATGTPGISDQVEPNEGFWIKQKDQVSDITGNDLIYPFEK